MNQSNDKFGIFLLLHLFDQYLELWRRPLPICNFDIRNRILENVLSDDFVVKDVYSSVVGRPYDFWMLSGETPESFQSLIELVNTDIIVHGNEVVSLKNRVLLTLIWLRQYPTYSLLSLTFGISTSTVSRIINLTWMKLWEICFPMIHWPTRQEWLNRRGKWNECLTLLK